MTPHDAPLTRYNPAYVALQECMDDPTPLDDFIEELEGLDEVGRCLDAWETG